MPLDTPFETRVSVVAGGIAVVTLGSFVDRNARAVKRSKQNKPHIRYPRAHMPLNMYNNRIGLA